MRIAEEVKEYQKTLPYVTEVENIKVEELLSKLDKLINPIRRTPEYVDIKRRVFKKYSTIVLDEAIRRMEQDYKYKVWKCHTFNRLTSLRIMWEYPQPVNILIQKWGIEDES